MIFKLHILYVKLYREQYIRLVQDMSYYTMWWEKLKENGEFGRKIFIFLLDCTLIGEVQHVTRTHQWGDHHFF